MPFNYGNLLLFVGLLLALLAVVVALLLCICRSPLHDVEEPQKEAAPQAPRDFVNECEKGAVGSSICKFRLRASRQSATRCLAPYALKNDTVPARPNVPRIILTTASFRTRPL